MCTIIIVNGLHIYNIVVKILSIADFGDSEKGGGLK